MSKTETISRLRLKAISLTSVTDSPLQDPITAAIGSRRSQTITGGRQWMKRGAGDADWIQQLIVGTRYFNVKDYGATGNGVTDDRAAINLAVQAAVATGGGVVFFPPGTYVVQRNGVTSSIPITGASNTKLLFLGCGRGSRVLASGSAGGGATGWYLFDITNGATQISFKNICLDGSAQTNLGVGQDHHLVRIAGLTSDVARVWFVDCYWNKTDGDGIRMIGSSGVGTSKTTKVQIIRGVFTMDVGGGGTGSRAGFTVQRNVTHVGAHSCLLLGSTDQVVDMETSGTGTTGDIAIERCHLLHSAPNSTTVCACNGTASVTFRRLLFANCIFDGGGIAFHDMTQFVLATCMQTVSRFVTHAGSILLDGVSDSLIYGCQFYRSDTSNSVGYSLQYTSGINGTKAGTVSGCICENASLPAAGQDGILVANAIGVLISDSMIYVAQASNNVGTCVRLRAIDTDALYNAVRRSLLVGTSGVVGVAAQIAAALTGLTNRGSSAFGNIMRNVLNAVGLSAVAGSTLVDYFGGNNAAVTTSQMFVTAAPAPIGMPVSGNGGSKALSIWEFTATPEAAIASQIGAFGCNRVGGAGTTLYVKQANGGLTTGWTAK